MPGYKYKNGDRRHHDQHCTATLVTEDIVLSGWHCLEYYSDLSKDIVFTLPYAQTDIQRTARHLVDGGGMHADWLLLKLSKPISGRVASPVPVSTLSIMEPGTQALTLAGYSRDSGLGAAGKRLSYDASCEILQNESYRVATDCVAFKGSSGGPVVHGHSIVGVVSAGDSEQLSYYTPSKSFITALRFYLH
ncbi:MAG: trypsin-like serine peptidase [Pseudomonadales bacterium]